MRFDICSPRPDCSRIPTGLPATAVVAATESTWRVPDDSAATSLRRLSAVSRRICETPIASRIDQKIAVMVEKPNTRNAMIAKSEVYWYQYRLVSDQNPGASRTIGC